MIRVEDADSEGPRGRNTRALQPRAEPWQRLGLIRPSAGRAGQPRTSAARAVTRTSYAGDDVFLAISRPVHSPANRPLKRVDIVALCTNRDLPILDDKPTLTLEAGDPVETVRLLGALRPPQPAIPAALPAGADDKSAPTIWPGGWWRSWRSTSSAWPRKAAASIRCTRCSISMPNAATRACPQCALDRAHQLARGDRDGCRSKGRCVSAAAPK